MYSIQDAAKQINEHVYNNDIFSSLGLVLVYTIACVFFFVNINPLQSIVYTIYIYIII